MPRTFIRDLRSNQSVNQIFLAGQKSLRSSKKGSLFLEVELRDKTGVLPAKLWDASERVLDSFRANNYVKVVGRTEVYGERLQLILTSIVPVDPKEVDQSDFLAQTQAGRQELLARLEGLIGSVKDAHLSALLRAVFSDPDVLNKFAEAPAAVQYHHAFLGGLLEHTVAVAELTRPASTLYPELDGELLLTGALLHDIGKICEMTSEGAFEYTDEGGLVGHLFIGALMVAEKAATIPDFPRDKLLLLQHMLLSHHGEHEFGAPKLPVTAEAIALHFLDNLDAKLFAHRNAVADTRDEESHWTDYSKMLERKLFKGFRTPAEGQQG